MQDRKLAETLRQLFLHTNGLPLDEAIALIDAELAIAPNDEWCAALVVRKANLLRGARHAESLEILERAVTRYPNSRSVSYFAGEHAAEAGLFQRAIDYLGQCIAIEEEAQNSWYLDAAYLLRAYCFAKNGDARSAQDDLQQYVRLYPDQNDPEFGAPMFWIETEPVISLDSVKRMLLDISQQKR